ncbi:MAG: ABC transporter ATP-binding protein [Candidatus Heimdallarchaeota archaeon]|nr:ABC transporter ATP-binding protein [Candidatus Heimdallarchaeota archaeon]MCK5048260.1 ABC transporter ATP-binding protein [Candidatus Heimdallarchaeota archaeon]
MLKANDLYFSYGNNEVFNKFNIEISSNLCGFVGINGAGKSTLLKLATGLIKPQKGDVELNGISIVKNRDKVLQNIGVLHENPKFPPWAEVLPYLRWVGGLRGLTKKEAYGQAILLLNKLNIVDRKNDRVSDLSAGLTQRFGLAQALIGVPKIIFLDEPTANLDAHSRITVLELLKTISQKYNSQIIIMSHVLSDLERYCDGVVILHEGEVKYHNTIINLLSNHHHRLFFARGEEDQLQKAINEINNLGVEIISSKPQEITFELNEKQSINKITSISIPLGVIITPVRSVLEQLFLDTTGLKPLMKNVEI